MDKNSVDWHGPWNALVTPFDAKGAIDEAAYARNVDLCVGYGNKGLVANGCTGEFWAQSMDERVRVFKIAVAAARGRTVVLGGCGAVRTEDAIELAKAAEGAGCNGILLLPPYFVRPGPDEIVAHVEAVSDAIKLPIMVYNIPSAVGYSLSPDLVSRLADVRNVVALKESSQSYENWYATYVRCSDRIRCFIGPGSKYGMAAVEAGAPGWVEASANYLGKPACDLYYATAEGDLDRARALQKMARALRDVVDVPGRNIYTSFKAAMNIRGLPGGYPREPLRPLPPADVERIRKGLAEQGIGPHAAAAKVAE